MSLFDLFSQEVCSLALTDDKILVSYDVVSLFTNVPLRETIQILVDKAFTDDWFNKKNSMNLQKFQLVQVLEVATTNQLFRFNGKLYEQVDGVAMGSPLGPLMANVFMCHLEEKLSHDGVIPDFYPRYVDNTLSKMPNVSVWKAIAVLSDLKSLYAVI